MDLKLIIILLGVLILVFGTIVYLKKNGVPSFNEVADMIREPLLKLFLYAEKKEWSGPEKMEWCIDQILELLPIRIKVDEVTIRKIALYLYDEYREFILEMLKAEQKMLEEPRI